MKEGSNRSVEAYRNNFSLAFVVPAVGHEQATSIPQLYYEDATKKEGFRDFLDSPDNQDFLSQVYDALREDVALSEDTMYRIGLVSAKRKLSEIEKWDRGESDRVNRPELLPSDEKYLSMEQEGIPVPADEELMERQIDIQTRLNPLLEELDNRLQAAGVDTSGMEI
jgi:hypothetical protein